MRQADSDQLETINADLVEVTRLVGSAMNRATQALLDADLQLAEAVIDFDAKVDILTASIEERCFELVALKTSTGADLRSILGSMKMSSSLERMGDLAEHVAKQARMRHPKVAVPQEVRGTFAEMGGLAEAIDVTLLSRFYERYADHAVSVSKRVVTIVTGEPYVAVSLVN